MTQVQATVATAWESQLSVKFLVKFPLPNGDALDFEGF
jgi:hypothetical protein